VVPPFTGVAVKVTDVPAHTEFADASMETLTGCEGVTIIVTMFEVAGLPVAHGRLEFITTTTISSFAGA
jgi:hypothetical protein